MNKIEEHIETIEKLIMDHQQKNGFETVFDLINEEIAELKTLVKDYDFSHPVIPTRGHAWIEIIHEGFKLMILDDSLEKCFETKRLEYPEYDLIPHKHYKG
jgi:hypothetical protein